VIGKDGRFQVINGIHRLAASLLAGFQWIPVVVNPSSIP
jgi:ParB-like chromosome segregation protein Spo0J